MVEPETITIPQAAERLGVSRNNAYAAARDGTLPVIRLGHRLVVPLRALQKLLESGQAVPAGSAQRGQRIGATLGTPPPPAK